MAAIPGVQSVGSTFKLPLTGSGAQMPYAYNPETSQKWESLSADWRPVTPEYLPTMGARLLEGRNFSDADDANHPLVVIVDEMLARSAWPAESAIGKKLEVELLSRPENPRVFAMVIGVVAHLRNHDLTRNVRERNLYPQLAGTFRAGRRRGESNWRSRRGDERGRAANAGARSCNRSSEFAAA